MGNAAQAFAEQLDTSHKPLCPWKNISCAESLVQFPPTPPPVLLGGYIDRCEALLQLSALPVVSGAAIKQMKMARGLHIDGLLSEPPPSMPGFSVGNGVDTISTETDSLASTSKPYYQVSALSPGMLPPTF